MPPCEPLILVAPGLRSALVDVHLPYHDRRASARYWARQTLFRLRAVDEK